MAKKLDAMKLLFASWLIGCYDALWMDLCMM